MLRDLSSRFCFFHFDFWVLTQIKVAALNGELQALRSQLEDATSLHERELQSAREACTDLQARADVALEEVRMPFKGG